MNVTLLYFEDCPNWRLADGHLRTLAAEYGGITVERRLVESVDDAVATGFHGSPSILVDGADAFDAADAPIGLACRVYRTPAGPAGTPTIEQLRTAIAARLEEGARDE